jgi:hypothetical protein
MNTFFELVQLNTFDIASDAFATFKLLLTKHKTICAKWLNDNFDDVGIRSSLTCATPLAWCCTLTPANSSPKLRLHINVAAIRPHDALAGCNANLPISRC